MKRIYIEQPYSFFNGLIEVLGGMVLLILIAALMVIGFCL